MPKVENSSKLGKPMFEKNLSIIPVDKTSDQQIVTGIIYEVDTEDSQGDEANAEEVEKAAYNFMENVRVFKLMHKGKRIRVNILESYLAPQDLTINKQNVVKGSWVMTVRVLDKKIWKAIRRGKYNGFSMAGWARTA